MPTFIDKVLGQLSGKRNHPYCACIVPAAGSSTRMEGHDKLLEKVGGMTVIQRTLKALEDCPLIDEIIIVTRKDLIKTISALCVQSRLEKVANIVPGGETRTESVWLGLQAVSKRAELIAVHDGARPFPSQQLLSKVLKTGAQTSAAAPAIPLKDTIKRATGGVTTETLDRSTLYAVQTPQVFEYGLFKGAMHKAYEEFWDVTDDCSVVEKIGMKITLTDGEESNIKLTTPLDLLLGEVIAAWQEAQ